MNSVDEIIQNLIEKQKLSDHEKRSYSFDSNQIKAKIKQISDFKIYPAGSGAYKSVYPYEKDKVILEEGTYRQTLPFNIKKDIVKKLNDYGINTPKLIYYLTQDQAFKLGDKELSYEVQERATGSFLSTFDHEKIISHLYGLTGEFFNPDLNKDSEKLLCDKYNIEMLKSRVLTGIPHIEEFLKHFTCLSAADVLDVNEGNFLHSPAFGYAFVDLNLNALKDIDLSNLDEFFNSKINDINKSRIMTSYSYLMHCCVGIYGGMIFKQPPNKHFEAYVYSGLLSKQFLNIMQTSNDPKLRFAKEFAQNFNFSNFYGANPQDLDLIYSAIKSNDESLLELIRQRFDLPANYNFSDNLEGNKFIQAMDLTYAMEKPTNPTSDEDVAEI